MLCGLEPRADGGLGGVGRYEHHLNVRDHHPRLRSEDASRKGRPRCTRWRSSGSESGSSSRPRRFAGATHRCRKHRARPQHRGGRPSKHCCTPAVVRLLRAQSWYSPVSSNRRYRIVVAFADEPVSALTERIRAIGGYANVFVRDRRGVHFVSVIEEVCAIADPDDRMVGDEAPGATSTIGMLLAYVERHPNGVTISATLGHPACARDARQVELEPA